MKKHVFAVSIKALGLFLVVVFFSHCGNLHFMQRKYTKGYYHDASKELTHKKAGEKSAKLPDIESKTDLSVTSKSPVTRDETGEGAVASATPQNESATSSIDGTAALPQPEASLKPKVKVTGKTLKTLSKLPFSEVLLKKPKKSEAAKGDDEHLPSTILSVVGFACGILAIILAIFAIIASLIASALSPYFFIAIALGLIAIACGIVALVLGHGDLDGFQKTFATLAIALGGAGLIIALIWSFLVSLMIAE